MFEELFGKRATHIKPGLERIRHAYEYLNKPASKTPCILIGGTNGKGTTSAFVWRMLSQCGLKCGLYTSPHLQHFSERFSVSGETIDNEQIGVYWQTLKASLPADTYDDLSFFEIATLISFLLFDERKTDFNIFEVGLGGRLDATNIVEPVLSAITSIGLDHQAYLGDTMEAIAFEKAGIMRSGRSVMIGRVESTVADVLLAEAQRQGARPVFLSGDDEGLASLPAPLGVPAHLVHNLRLAQEIVRRLHADLSWSFDPGSIDPVAALSVLKDLAAVRGRYETMIIAGGQRLILDVAHNRDGVVALAQQVLRDFPGQLLPAFVSVLADKDVAEMLDLLRSMFSPVVLFRIKNERSFRREDLPLRHLGQSFHPSFADAWNACKDVWPKDVPWVVCGSLAAVGEVFDYFGVELSKAESSSGV